MKNNYYLIVRDNHSDRHPSFYGPFDSVEKAKRGANRCLVESGATFTIIAISLKGVSKHILSYSLPVSKNFKWS